MADPTHAYTTKDLRRAINISAVLGWAIFSAPFAVNVGIGMIPWLAAFGLPVAFLSCWLIGAPILWRVMRNPITWVQAATWGAIISGLIAGLSIVVGRILGWMQYRNPSSSSRMGGDGAVRSIDGILTPYGWQVLGQNTLLFMLLGVGVALIVRKLIGPGSEPT